MGKSEDLPTIPGYKIEKRLGHGGMAGVYLGVQEVLGRKVAIKILNPQMFKNTQVVKRFLNEARTASRLEHPNIVTIHDVGQMEDTCYIVMEYLPESLVKRIRNSPDNKLDPKEAVRILKRMAKALDYAHREGFIHRDIKPDNIMFRRDNTPVLVDFGIARAIDTDAQLTANGMIIGTPHYMSPEQCRGEKIDGQTDIYSLGIVFYEMLTGDIPFRADSAAGILVKQIQEPLPQLPPEMERFQALVNRMVAKEKRQRIKSGEEILQLLDRSVPHTPLETIVATRPEKWVFKEDGEDDDDVTTITPYKQTGKSKSLKWVALFIFLLLAAGIAYYFLGYVPAHQKNERINGEPANNREVLVKEPEIKTPDKKEKVNTAGETGKPAVENNVDKDYRRLFTLAEVYFKEGKINQAQEKLKQAKELKNTPQLNALQKQINEHLEQEKLDEFNRYFSQANQAYKKRNYKKAKENISLAKKVMESAQLEALSKKIKQKEDAAARKARQAEIRKKRDNNAFQKARASNTPYAYEKYLEQFPSGRHAKEAKKRFEELKSSIQLENKIKDDVAYELATSKNTIAAYRNYLQQFPLGLHTQEVNIRIQKLKANILKEVKVKIDVQEINFFESGLKALPVGQRSYKNRFPRETSRYIYTEIKYKNKLYGISDSTSRVRLEYKGGSNFGTINLKGMIESVQEAEEGIYWRGMGWPDAGKWPTGSYTVSLYIEDQKVNQAQFEIY